MKHRLSLGVLILALNYFVFASALPSALSCISQDVRTLWAEYQNSKVAKGRSFQQLDRENKLLKSRLDLLRKYLNIRNEKTELLSFLQDAITSSKLTHAELQSLPESVAGGVSELPYQISVSGPFHQIATLINKLEMGGPAVRIRAVQLVSPALVSREVKANLHFSVFSKSGE